MINTSLEPIKASPVKSFFVSMLTRDIELKDAILDLLDNCVDGVQRSETRRNLDRKQPYKGYWAKILISKDKFRIEDNCGGIPWKLHDYAFRMGRVKKDISVGRRMIGTYGIGMKRAIFKIGQDCMIETHAKDASYQLHISSEWMKNEDNWELHPKNIKTAEQKGTSIEVKDIRHGVQKEFISPTFSYAFYEAISTNYAYIIKKGFSVYINDKKVVPKRINLLFAKSSDQSVKEHPIKPFIYKTLYKKVQVFLAVGFTRNIPNKEEADASFSDYKEEYSSADAGWTVVCNDRTVVYCDKGPLTGWGISGVPQFHMQFIAISGIVVFSSDDADLLPMTTTKRGIDAQSEIYLHVKDKMIEGMKIFTSYTNIWKSKDLVSESRRRFKETSIVDLDDLQSQSSQLQMAPTHGVIKGKQYKPVLPRPKTKKETDRISFTRRISDIRRVSKYLFDSPDRKPSKVGEECFEQILEETKQ